MSNSLSERLKTLRGTRKKSEFARLLGLSAPDYQRYENGRTPRVDVLSVIAKRLNVTVEWLLTGHGSYPAETEVSEQKPADYGSAEALREEIVDLRKRLELSERREAELLLIIKNLSTLHVGRASVDAQSERPFACEKKEGDHGKSE